MPLVESTHKIRKSNLIFSYYKLIHRLCIPLILSVTHLRVAILLPKLIRNNKQFNTNLQDCKNNKQRITISVDYGP